MSNPNPAADSETQISDLNSRANLEKLVEELGEFPERRDDIIGRIREVFQQEKAILILDMSGFTRTTQKGKVIDFLLMIHQMRALALPIVEEHGGILNNAHADNLTCVLDTVDAALESAKLIQTRLEAVNIVLPAERELYASIGIGYGEVLNIHNEAIFGNEVNLASKLGEDVAERSEILLTPSAHEQVTGDYKFRESSVSISGLQIGYYVLES